MPELPEVETMVRGIAPVLTGGRLRRVAACDCRCRPILTEPSPAAMHKRTVGRTIQEVIRRAKRILIRLDSGDAFVIEPRMTGLMLRANPPNLTHLRIQWSVLLDGDTRHVWFWDQRGLGTVRLLRSADVEELLHGPKLGPDALEMTPDLWRLQLRKTSRPIKVALLDQKLIAGIGNLYASEILHAAGIHPAARGDRLSVAQIERLSACALRILHTAIESEGSTLSDGTYRNSLNEAGGYQASHVVYDRADEPCPRCGDRIQRIVQAQRSTFFCGGCQTRR
jgi:formamidopyrimidine-DNA glycosylase